MIVLVAVALAIAIIGATAGSSLFGGDEEGDSPPFSLLPITVPGATSAAPNSVTGPTSAVGQTSKIAPTTISSTEAAMASAIAGDSSWSVRLGSLAGE